MAEVKWIKIVTDIFDDEKILLIESMPDRDSIIVIWFKLLCLAGKTNNGGVLLLNDCIPYTDEMLSTIFRRPVNTIRFALKTFEEFGMILIVNDTITIPNWGKHQSIDQLENKRDYMKKYMQEYRQKQKEIACKTNSKTNSKANVRRTDKDIDIEEDKDIILSADKPQKKSKVFKPPAIDEVKEYCAERQNNVDAEKFVDYYTSNGWKVGKNPMKDWKAAVRNWEKQGWNGYGYGGDKKQKPKSAGKHDNFDNNSFNDSDLDALFGR